MSYSEFSYLIDDGRAKLLIDTGDFKIYEINGRYLERGKGSETDTLCELELVAKLEYTVVHDVRVDGEELDALFDSYCCGEHVTDDRIEYLWFNKKEAN